MFNGIMNLLTTQLMQISLRLDDHIYNDRPLCGADAARYLQEVATLKLRCLPTNARVWQVIEKLTLLLGNILTEEGDHGPATCSLNKSFHINTELAGSASPVYSLPDEDRNDVYEQSNASLNSICISDDDETIHKQINIHHGQNNEIELAGSLCPAYKINAIPKQVVDMNNLSTNHISSDEISHKEIFTAGGQITFITSISNKQGITSSQAGNTCPENYFDNGQVIDITNDSNMDETNETFAVSNKPNVSIDHVNFGVSNMAINDKVGNQTKLLNDDVNSSQSILENYANDNENETPANKKDGIILNMSHKEKNAKACVINKVNNYFQKQTSLAGPPSQNISAPAIILANSQPTKVNSNTYKKLATQDTILLENKMRKKKKAGDVKDKPKKRRTKKNSKPKENKTAHNPVLHDLNVTMVCKDVTNKINNSEHGPKRGQKSRTLKKIPKIYNENVVNDLSWVENLRYVREVSPSEYDPGLSMLQDDFWDNFDLPGTWNNLDFEV